MKQILLPPLLAACLALPALVQAQTSCTGPNATSNYIVGEAEGRPSAMHWETGLVWSRCIEGATFDNGQCHPQSPASNFQKTWVEWADHDTGRAGLLPAPFYNNVNWGLNVSISPNHLLDGAWRLPYATEYSALMTGCSATSPEIALNPEVLPSDNGGGIRNTFWTASPDPTSTSAAWRANPGNPTGQMLSTAGTEEARVVRGGQPFSALPAVPPATGAAGQPHVFAPITLTSPPGTTAWGGVRISSGRLSVNAGPWVSEAIVKTGDSIRVRLIAPANGAAGVTLTLRSGQTTGTTADGANGGQEATVMHEETASFSVTATGTFTPRACRVTPSGTGDGTSWAQAASLADALADHSCSEVWLKQSAGTPYVPSGARGFVIERNVKLYGGFVGTEVQLSERPQPVAPGTTVLDASGNSRVLYLDGSLGIPLNDTLIDGVYLLMGAAAGPGANGGTLYCNGAGAGSVCSPRLNMVHIEASSADGHGGALFNDASRGGVSSPELTNVLIRNSQAGGNGGVIYNRGEGGTSSPVLKNVYFENNSADGSGGALYNLARGSGGVSSPVIEQASFDGNGAGGGYGGAIFSGAESGGTSQMQVRNATFAHNKSAFGTPGGAIAIEGVDGVASVDVVHATFIDNTAGGNGNALFTQGGDVRVSNSVLWGSAATRYQAITFSTGSTTITDSMIQDGCAGIFVPLGGGAACNGLTLDVDPELGVFGANGVDGFPFPYGYLPEPTSPLLDAVACTVSADQRGIARPHGAGATPCDIGALERRIYELAVTLTGSGTGTVTGAASACATGTCSYNYPGEGSAQLVTLTAAPAVGHTFTGWSGACSGTSTCTVTMNQARTVGAAFAGPATYTVGGTASGLAGGGLVLQNNGGDNLPVPGNGPFTFSTPVVQGGAYGVTVFTQPPGQTCAVTSGSGTASANVASVQVACAASTYAITASPVGNLACTPATVTHGGTAQCTATPPAGQVTQSISGCYGTATGAGVNTYTTGPVTGACTVTATFAPLPMYILGGSVTGLTGTGLLLRNGGEDLPVPANGAFTFTQLVAHGGSYAVTIAAQPTGQRCTIANASGSNVTANVGNVQVACTPYFEGTTVPASGAGGTGSATFTGGGPGCRFDLGATGFEAAPTALPSGRTLPQGLLRVRLVNCTAAVAMEITWPQAVAGYTKYGLADRTDTLPSYFAPTGLDINGHTVRFTLTDGQQGDDDWAPNGTIADPSGPTALAAAPGGAQAIPTLSEGGLLLLTALLGLLALLRRVV